jgi:hypothetical protein
MLSSNIGKSDYFLQISRGLVPGATYFHNSAVCPDVDNVELIVRHTTQPITSFVLPANSGESMEIVSSSANDAYPSGTGARTARIIYLDTDFLEQTVDVNLNGTAPVAITPVDKPIARVNRLGLISFGGSTLVKGADGRIDVRKVGTTTTNIYRGVAAGATRAHSSVYTVPANKQFFMYSWHFFISVASGAHYGYFKLWTNGEVSSFPTLGTFPRYIILGITQDAHDEDDFDIPLRFMPKADIFSSVVSDTGSANAIAGVEYYGFFEEIA